MIKELGNKVRKKATEMKVKTICKMTEKKEGSMTVEAALLIVIAFLVCIIFKDQIVAWLKDMFSQLTTSTGSLFSGITP